MFHPTDSEEIEPLRHTESSQLCHTQIPKSLQSWVPCAAPLQHPQLWAALPVTFQNPKAQSSLPAVPAEGHRDLLIAAFLDNYGMAPEGFGRALPPASLNKSMLLLLLCPPLALMWTPAAPSSLSTSTLSPQLPASLRILLLLLPSLSWNKSTPSLCQPVSLLWQGHPRAQTLAWKRCRKTEE